MIESGIDLAEAYESAENTKAACSISRKLLGLCERGAGLPKSLKVALLDRLAIWEIFAERRDNARDCFRRAEDAFAQALEAASAVPASALVDHYFSRVSFHLAITNLPFAEIYANPAPELVDDLNRIIEACADDSCDQSFENRDGRLCMTRFTLSHVMHARGETEAALALINTAVDDCRASLQMNDSAKLAFFSLLGEAYLSANRVAEAHRVYEEAFKIAERSESCSADKLAQAALDCCEVADMQLQNSGSASSAEARSVVQNEILRLSRYGLDALAGDDLTARGLVLEVRLLRAQLKIYRSFQDQRTAALIEKRIEAFERIGRSPAEESAASTDLSPDTRILWRLRWR